MFRWVMIVLAACLRRSWAVHGFLQAGQTSEDYDKGPFLPGGPHQKRIVPLAGWRQWTGRSGVLCHPPNRLPGTLTMNASKRLPRRFVVQMKYRPVTSRFPFGALL